MYFLLPALSKGLSSSKTFLASKHKVALRLVGAVIPSAPAALPVKGEPSSGVCLVLIAKTVTLPVKYRKRNAFSLNPVLGQIGHHGSLGLDSSSKGNLLQIDLL